MRNEDGTYYVTADELRGCRDSGRQHWYLNEDGSMQPSDDPPALDGTVAWPLYLLPYQESWFAHGRATWSGRSPNS